MPTPTATRVRATAAVLVLSAVLVALGTTWLGPVAAPSAGAAALTATPVPGPAPSPLPTWTGTWATALTDPAPGGPGDAGFTDLTLRQVVHLSLGGPQVRLHLSNAHGTAPLVVGAVTVAVQGVGGGPSTTSPPVAVTFGGSARTTIAVGQQRTSDPVTLSAADGASLVVSTWLPGTTGRASTHPSAAGTTWVAPGSSAYSTAGAFAPLGRSWFFLAGVDVPAAGPSTVVLLGDSVTDGLTSSPDLDRRPSDALAARLRAAGSDLGVLNAGLSGNRLLTDTGSSGAAAVRRFHADVVDQTGVRAVVVLIGVNDLIASDDEVPLADLIAGYTDLVAQGHAAGLRVLGATIPPYLHYRDHTADGEALRQAVNAWIRTSGVFDDVVDADQALRDPSEPTALLPALDSGDHLHPNDAGYAALAAAVDLTALTRSP